MKCPSCGAEVRGRFCDYCGSEMPQENGTINIVNNYYGDSVVQGYNRSNSNAVRCPKCGGSRIVFRREQIGTETQSHSRKRNIGTGRKKKTVSQMNYRTVGICQSCGYTWSTGSTKGHSGGKTWLWVLGWIFIFPLPLTVLMLRKKNMNPVIKYGIVAAAWLLFIAIGVSGNSETEENVEEAVSSSYTEGIEGEQSEDGIVSENSAEQPTDEEISKETLLEDYIDGVVSEYNDQAGIQLEYVEDFVPSDKENSHYRTEFRLTAYNDAVGRSYLLGDAVVDIVATQTVFGEINCRAYINRISIEQVASVLQGLSPILDNTLAQDELLAAIDEVTTQKTANGYYYGDLGLTLFGNDEEGYRLMLKTD